MERNKNSIYFRANQIAINILSRDLFIYKLAQKIVLIDQRYQDLVLDYVLIIIFVLIALQDAEITL